MTVPRFWTEDQYSRLLAVKRTWDPELVFSCRHCVGDGEEPGDCQRFIFVLIHIFECLLALLTKFMVKI